MIFILKKQDCIQAWGEAFTPRRHMYPHIYEAYTKMRYKYGIPFLRPHFDPTRVPIFLGPITQPEKFLVNEYGEDGSDTNASASVKDATEEEFEEGKQQQQQQQQLAEPQHAYHATEPYPADLMEMQRDLLEFSQEEEPSTKQHRGSTGTNTAAVVVGHPSIEQRYDMQPQPFPVFNSEPPQPRAEVYPASSANSSSSSSSSSAARFMPYTLPPYLPPPVPSTMSSSASAMQQNPPQPVYLHPHSVPPITGRISCIEESSSTYHNWRITATRDIELKNTAEPAAVPVFTLDEEVQRMMRTKQSQQGRRLQPSRPRDEIYFAPTVEEEEDASHCDRKKPPICAVVSEDDSNPNSSSSSSRFNRGTIQLTPLEDPPSSDGRGKPANTIVSPTTTTTQQQQQQQDTLTQADATADNRGDGVSVAKKPLRRSAPAFIVPSSAPENEIRYYGTQRVVVTRKSAT